MSEKNQQHKSKIGGQALIEGIMMNGVKKGAMACRLPNGEIDVEMCIRDRHNAPAEIITAAAAGRNFRNFISCRSLLV